jgi:hypothetical protein
MPFDKELVRYLVRTLLFESLTSFDFSRSGNGHLKSRKYGFLVLVLLVLLEWNTWRLFCENLTRHFDSLRLLSPASYCAFSLSTISGHMGELYARVRPPSNLFDTEMEWFTRNRSVPNTIFRVIYCE